MLLVCDAESVAIGLHPSSHNQTTTMTIHNANGLFTILAALWLLQHVSAASCTAPPAAPQDP